MTMQVGMLGTDGVILAGDTRLIREPLPGLRAPWKTYDGPKIRIGPSGRIAISCAHDMQTANAVADAIFAQMAHGGHPRCECEIKNIAVSVASGRAFECLIAFSDPLPSLYLLQYSQGRSDVESQKIIDCATAGDTNNPAVFWGMTYYIQDASDRPIREFGRLYGRCCGRTKQQHNRRFRADLVYRERLHSIVRRVRARIEIRRKREN